MAKCEVCGKGPQFGNHVSFSQRHVKRRWNVNIQKHKLTFDGKTRQMQVCANCLKTMAKAQ